MPVYTLFHIVGGEQTSTNSHGFSSRDRGLSFLTNLNFQVAALSEHEGVTEIMARSPNGTAMHFRLVAA